MCQNQQSHRFQISFGKTPYYRVLESYHEYSRLYLKHVKLLRARYLMFHLVAQQRLYDETTEGCLMDFIEVYNCFILAWIIIVL